MGSESSFMTEKKNYVMKLEASRNKHEIPTNSEHYKNVAPKAPTSIPQIQKGIHCQIQQWSGLSGSSREKV